MAQERNQSAPALTKGLAKSAALIALFKDLAENPPKEVVLITTVTRKEEPGKWQGFANAIVIEDD